MIELILGYRVGPVFVIAGVAGCEVKYQKYDRANTRNECEQYIPTALADIVEPPHGHGHARHDRRQRVENVKRAIPNILDRQPQNVVQDHCRDSEDRIEQHEEPILLTPCAAAEYRIFLKDFQIPIHVSIPPRGRMSISTTDDTRN